jgi:hypothetical protein
MAICGRLGAASTHLSDRTVTDDLQINIANQYQVSTDLSSGPRRRNLHESERARRYGWGDMPSEGKRAGRSVGENVLPGGGKQDWDRRTTHLIVCMTEMAQKRATAGEVGRRDERREGVEV